MFPLSVPVGDWWSPRPHTDLPNEIDGLLLSKWFPARVQHVDDNGDIAILFAKPPEDSAAEADFSELDVPHDTLEAAAYGFDHQCLHEGSFIELGYYGDKGILKIGLHAECSLNDPDLIPLVPPPDRWYRRAVQASWNDDGGGH